MMGSSRRQTTVLWMAWALWVMSTSTSAWVGTTIPKKHMLSKRFETKERVNVDVDVEVYHESKGTGTGGGSTGVVLRPPSPSPHEQSSNEMAIKPRRRQRRRRHEVVRLFRRAKELEKGGRWAAAAHMLEEIVESVDRYDARSYLALARLQSRRGYFGKAREIYAKGTEECPDSVHLWQAWAVFEANSEEGDSDVVRQLFERALALDESNPYVCHSYGLWMLGRGNRTGAVELWKRAVQESPTAALVCSLGDALTAANSLERDDLSSQKEIRDLYARSLLQISDERERTEVFLQAASFEERCRDVPAAVELVERALTLSPSDSRAHAALARLETAHASEKSTQTSRKMLLRDRLRLICTTYDLQDGRLYHQWARLEMEVEPSSSYKANGHGREREVKKKKTPSALHRAQAVLAEAIEKFPDDPTLQQAMGVVEEKLHRYARALECYIQSLRLGPSAPALVAYARLEHKRGRHTLARTTRLFEEALRLDPKHGPTYNAYGNFLSAKSKNRARDVYERGLRANCTDTASVYHGYAMLELRDDPDRARELLWEGLNFAINEKPEKTVWLRHTLGMLELDTYRNATGALDVLYMEDDLPASSSSRLLLGRALCERALGRSEQARVLFEKSARHDPDHVHAWQAWACAEIRDGRYDEAARLLDQGLLRDPTHGALWQAYATMKANTQNYEEARVLFAAGVKFCPRHVPLYRGWACLELRHACDRDEARKLIGKALTLDKHCGENWLVAAKIEDFDGKPGLARLLVERGLLMAPDHSRLATARARHLIGIREIDKARQILRRALDANPHDGPLYHALAELEAMVGNLDGLADLHKSATAHFTEGSPTMGKANGNGNGNGKYTRTSGNAPSPSRGSFASSTRHSPPRQAQLGGDKRPRQTSSSRVGFGGDVLLSLVPEVDPSSVLDLLEEPHYTPLLEVTNQDKDNAQEPSSSLQM